MTLPDLDMNSEIGMRGDLAAHIIRGNPPQPARWVRTPFGRLMFTRDKGDAGLFGTAMFGTNLTATHMRGGVAIDRRNLGSGLTTNVAAQAIANDFAWASDCQTLKLANFHAVGTGTTAAAATDIACQTLASPTATTAVTGAQTFVNAANVQIYQTVATTSFTGTAAITEWGLHTAATLSATTGTPATATSASSLTATATPYTASTSSVRGQEQMVVRTGTTTVYGLIKSNTTSVLTIPAWYKVADGTAGSTPGTTEAFTIIPVLYDHKVFAALNVLNGDSIVWTYQLTIASGT